MENKKIIQVEEKVPCKLLVPLSIQHMFAMFGASVLVHVRIFKNHGFKQINRNIEELKFTLLNYNIAGKDPVTP